MKFIKPRKAFLSTVAVLLLSLLGACGPVLSIHPLYTDKDVVFDPALLGSWIDPTDKTGSPLVFEGGGSNSYKASMRLGNNTRLCPGMRWLTIWYFEWGSPRHVITQGPMLRQAEGRAAASFSDGSCRRTCIQAAGRKREKRT